MNNIINMNPIVSSDKAVLLVGAGDVAPEQLIALEKQTDSLVGADGGANHIIAAKLTPDAVIGDFDSISNAAKNTLGPEKCFVIADQNSTDLTKGINGIEAPLILGLGFFGDRLDHQMAAQTALIMAADRTVILLGQSDMVFVTPPRLRLDLPMDERFSLYPMAPTTARSSGLFWALDGLSLSPVGQTSTSNHINGPLEVLPNDPLLLSVLSHQYLPQVMEGFLSGRFGAWNLDP